MTNYLRLGKPWDKQLEIRPSERDGCGPRRVGSHINLLSAAVAGAAGVAGQPVLAAGGTAARPIRRQQDTPLLGETVTKILLGKNNRWQHGRVQWNHFV